MIVRRRTLRQVGGSVMIAIPPALLRHVDGTPGDEVSLIAVDGGILVSRYTRTVERAHDALEKMHRGVGQSIRRLVTPPPPDEPRLKDLREPDPQRAHVAPS